MEKRKWKIFLVTALLCLMSNTMAHRSLLGLSAPPHGNSSGVAPSNPSPRYTGLQGYRRFHANDSLIGQPIPCTHEEKICFQYNLLFAKSQCKTSNGINIGDQTEFLSGTGHLRVITTLQYYDLCASNDGYRMAYDGLCYQRDIVSDIICGCNDEPTSHILGGMECRCSPPTPIHVDQPEEEGRCRIPDLRFPTNRSHIFKSMFEDIEGFQVQRVEVSPIPPPRPRFGCSSEQAQCFSEGKVWVAEGKGCFPLLEKGPCAEEHVVALDAQAAREGRAEAKCVHVRGGCPEGHLRMAFDGQCHNEKEMKIVTAGWIYSNQFGLYLVATRGIEVVSFNPFIESRTEREDLCFVDVSITVWGAHEIPLLTYCGSNNKNKCPRLEVITEPPKPEF